MDNLEYLKEVEKSIQKKYKKKLWRPFCKAINQYELVKPGDKIAMGGTSLLKNGSVITPKIVQWELGQTGAGAVK